MNTTEITQFDGDIGEIKYDLQFPPLSYIDYCLGASLTARALYKKTQKHRFPAALLIVSLYIVVRVFVDKFNVIIVASNIASDDFTHLSENVVTLITLGIFFLGYLAFHFILIFSTKNIRKKIYQMSPIAHTGYALQMGEKGIRIISPNSIDIIKWELISNLFIDPKMDFLAIESTNFLWLPINTQGYDPQATRAFILSKIAPSEITR